MSDGTVLHEIQSLERQLDRLVPSLEKFNQRISTVEADVRNIVDRLNSLGCTENLKTLNDLKARVGKEGVVLQKDIEAIEKDIGDLGRIMDAIQKEEKAEKKTTEGRAWSVFSQFIGALFGAAAGYFAAKYGTK